MSLPVVGRVDPHRPLVRAKPLSASDQHDAIHDRNGAPGPPSMANRRSSFRRTLHDLKDRSSKAVQRSRSLNTRGDAQKRAHRLIHSRSLSDFKMASSQAGTSLGLFPEPSTERKRAPALSPVSERESANVPIANGKAGSSPPPALSDIRTLHILRRGTLLTKVSAKKQQVRLFRLEADLGQIVWVSKTQKIIPIECIKEIRSGEDIRYTREHLHLAEEYQDRWLSIIYILDGNYKTLHLIAPDHQTFEMWNNSLRALFSIRQELMRGLGNGEMRQALWEKQYWKAADEEPDHKLSFSEIEGLCRKLNVNVNREDLLRMFKQADVHSRHYLDFNDFRLFVKLLKSRPEIERIYKKLRGGHGGLFTFQVFAKFMKEKQKSKLDQSALQVLFDKYSTQGTTVDIVAAKTDTQTPIAASRVMTVEAFTSFLLSPDNSAFPDQHSSVSHDMTFPLPHYYISSSHNTYLVGHQLVGDSSTEGYIRALLHGCRSVEVDIYDGEIDPMVFHGKTLTSKVPLREVCKAIIKYGFSSSPYPIIISAEVHCSIQQQSRIAAIMIEEFGDALVRMPIDGVTKLDALPSPEELKGKILLKAKNQNLVRADSGDNEAVMSEFSPSASDSDAFHILTQPASSTSNPSSESLHKEKTGKSHSAFLQRLKSIGKKTNSHSRDNVVPHSPEPITFSASAPSPGDTSHTKTGLIHRARRSLRGSFSSASDGPSLPLERSISALELHGAAPQPLTFVQRLRMGPEAQSSEPSSAPVLLQPILKGPVSPTGHVPSRRRQSAPGSETGIDPSTPPLSPSLSSSPTSHSPNTAGANGTNFGLVSPEMRVKSKMSPQLLSLLVYTVGVKFRGINKKEEYAPEHMFSLSENVANKMLRFGMWDLIKHTKNHLVRTYPKGTRVKSTNYEPHRFWAAGMQLVALNWQTFDLGYMINHAMFQRNGRTGYVLKPDAIRLAQKDVLAKRTQHILRVKVISGQQLPRPKDASGREIGERQVADPYVEVTLFVPDWPIVPEGKKEKGNSSNKDGPVPKSPLLAGASVNSATSSSNYSVAARTSAVKKNGFNPVWEEELGLQFDCVGDMMDLIFVRFVVKQESKDADEPLAVYCASLGSLQQGYRHLPLHDSQMSQYLFSTLFVRINITAVAAVS